ncbi:MAG: 50S ribosomal protein L24 [Deltaproteobacteria bacterium]|jgi:large subunit ribosomal protein L24|nr:50S ribosomal protein L24 [Deltaproteobacteria bacterium]
MRKKPNPNKFKTPKNYRVGDKVIVLTGKFKGKYGNVQTYPNKKGRILVEGQNTTYRHVKNTNDPAKPSGRVLKENPLHASNVRVVCPNCSLPVKPRIRVDIIEEDGKRVKEKSRVCRRCGQAFPPVKK